MSPNPMPRSPRFVIGAVGGYPLRNNRFMEVWGVRDSWLNYALVREFRGGNAERNRARAEELAAKLERAGNVDRKERATSISHGSLAGYTSPKWRCRCELCRAAQRDYQREYRRKAKEAA